MLGLPASTELRGKLITKKKVYEHFGTEMSPERRRRFDADVARMMLTNEVSPATVNLAPGAKVQNFFVLHVTLKSQNIDPQNVAYIPRLFGQRMVLVLEAEGKQRLALWQTKLIMGEWAEAGALSLPMNGLDLDKVWEGVVSHIAGFEMQQGHTLDEQIALETQKAKLQKDIARLRKKAQAEKQPNKKFEIVQEMKALQKKLEELTHG